VPCVSSTAQSPPPSARPRPTRAVCGDEGRREGRCFRGLLQTNLSPVPSVRTGTEPKEPKPNGSFFGSDFPRTEISQELKNRTDRFGSNRTPRASVDYWKMKGQAAAAESATDTYPYGCCSATGWVINRGRNP
jgi:hypothetical protein